MTETPPDPPPETPPDDDELAGLDERARRLIDRANNESAGRRHERDELRTQLADLQHQHDELQRQNESEQERRDREAFERGRQEGASEIQTQLDALHRTNLTLWVSGQIAERVVDPDVVVGLLPVDQLGEIDDPGKRRAALDKALDDLLKTKTYLARQASRKPPLVTQGGRSQEPNGRPRERSWLRG